MKISVKMTGDHDVIALPYRLVARELLLIAPCERTYTSDNTITPTKLVAVRQVICSIVDAI